jgi:alpha-tubulin suppressor-like RCC1 family protein
MPKKINTMDKKVVNVESGPNHVMALMSNGEVYAWGDNTYGQLGIGTKDKFLTSMAKVAGLEGRKIRRIACGNRHTLFVDHNGDALACGSDQWLQLGRGETWVTVRERRRAISRVPVGASLLQGSKVIDCAASADTSYFMVENPASLDPASLPNGQAAASVQAAGYGQFGQLGNSTWSHYAKTLCPVKKLGEIVVTSAQSIGVEDTTFSCGDGHCAILLQATNKVLAWGKNNGGQCGNGKLNNLHHPVSTATVAGKPWPGKTSGTAVRAIHSNFNRSAAIVADAAE